MRFWGDLLIAVAMIVSNMGSAWAGMEYEALRENIAESSAPANVGFQIMGWTVYPLAMVLLVLGVYLRGRQKRS